MGLSGGNISEVVCDAVGAGDAFLMLERTGDAHRASEMMECSCSGVLLRSTGASESGGLSWFSQVLAEVT